MSTYAKASKDVLDRASAIIAEHYPILHRIGLKIDFLFAHAKRNENDEPTGPAIKFKGYPAYGLCRIVSLKDRVKGHGDAEILLDGDEYGDWSPAMRNAIIDHELHHIQLVVEPDTTSVIKVDDIGRPKLRMKKHDVDFGWFYAIAARHGSASIEVQQAKLIQRTAGKILFQPELFEPTEVEGHQEPGVEAETEAAAV